MAIQGVWVFLFRGQEAKKKKLVFRYKSDVVKGSVRFINFKDSHSYITHTGGSVVKNLPANTGDQSLGQDHPLEKEMATHSTTLAWEIPWAEASSGLQCMDLQRVWTQHSDYTTITTAVFLLEESQGQGRLLGCRQ